MQTDWFSTQRYAPEPQKNPESSVPIPTLGLFDTNKPVYDPAEEDFRRRMQKEEKEARAKIVNAYQLVLHVSYWSTLFNAPLLKIAIKHIETFVFALYSLNLHTVRLILYKTT